MDRQSWIINEYKIFGGIVMSFNFSVPTNALFGAGKIGELHTQINTPMGVVHGNKA